MSSYIGATPTIGGYHKLDQITTDGSASYTMQLNSGNFVPESVNHLIVSVNGVIQAPTDSFTVSGSTITFASSLSVSDTIDFIMALGNVLDIGVPSDATVSLSKLTATGTPSASTFLRGDNSWASAGGTNTPAFASYLSSSQTGIPHETFTKINFDTELFDEGGYYDTSNYRWTPPVGKYVLYAKLFTYDTDGGTYRMRKNRIAVYKNGSLMPNPQIQGGFEENTTVANSEAEFQRFSVLGATIINQTSASDYYEVYGFIGNDNGDSNNGVSSNGSVFFGFKLIE